MRLFLNLWKSLKKADAPCISIFLKVIFIQLPICLSIYIEIIIIIILKDNTVPVSQKRYDKQKVPTVFNLLETVQNKSSQRWTLPKGVRALMLVAREIYLNLLVYFHLVKMWLYVGLIDEASTIVNHSSNLLRSEEQASFSQLYQMLPEHSMHLSSYWKIELDKSPWKISGLFDKQKIYSKPDKPLINPLEIFLQPKKYFFGFK